MIWWTWSGSNRRPLPCHGSALPAAPQAHIVEKSLSLLSFTPAISSNQPCRESSACLKMILVPRSNHSCVALHRETLYAVYQIGLYTTFVGNVRACAFARDTAVLLSDSEPRNKSAGTGCSGASKTF